MEAALAEAEVLDNREVARGYYRLQIRAPQLAATARPGQFALLRCTPAEQTDPLLRRPLSLHSVNQQEKWVTFLYRVAGRGTGLLSHLEPGDTINYLGPLGNGFAPVSPASNVAVVGGGIGIAPLVYLAQTAHMAGCQVHVFLGARTADSLLVDPWLVRAATTLQLATDDGSRGEKGTVVDLLQRHQPLLNRCHRVYICGPEPMMAAAVALCRTWKIDCQISLESFMACGVGACLGCACRTCGSDQYKRVCTDGPVFDGKEVIFHGHTQS